MQLITSTLINFQPEDAPGMGELALGPLMFGSSSTLLNASHYDVYFKGMPSWNGLVRNLWLSASFFIFILGAVSSI